MKKNNYIKLFTAFAAFLSLTSCIKDDENYASTVSDRPNVTISATSYSVTEGGDVLVTMVADKPYRTSLDFNLEVLSGNTAVAIDDFTVNVPETVFGSDPWNGIQGYLVQFPANTTSYTFSISTILDDLPEVTENVSFRLTMAGNHNGNLAESSRLFDVAIANGVQDELQLTFDWDQSFDFGGSTFTLCDIAYDNDFYIYDGASLNPLITQTDAAAATGDCPETFTMNLADYPNGNYKIYQNLYDDNGLSSAGITPAFSIPVKVHYLRGGSASLDGTFTQDPAYAIDSNTLPNPTATAQLYYVVTVNVNNGVFTLLNDNTAIASGKHSKVNKAFKSLKAKNNLNKKKIKGFNS
ncbi:hypothetical protein [Flavobacterium aquatile]|uniref:Uncharacterized protein n=1 Tax=Flavobacterium aquatile LMG 4008 = ATCC 11947 TaxID=1453498 RepID=A0A095V3S7_9FLAO|nr:hypothetical protein [Flavobacterium aquatile]KGD69520.1 hypothetical protein LG45_01780 [Flavobacterium aquatile LMG 4008 = ATCC 11947]OXA66026.1 hypothetical protein B0A61_12155 [Flavobacterium aquatile LMG 4008 = ATCC 11947]GEC77500.1 hypothetical protein FAQ01_03700 [Flavobacterium aquatile]